MAGSAQAANGIDTTALQKAVDVGTGTQSGIRQHLKTLQEIADRPGNSDPRSTATKGHEESVDYVEQQLRRPRRLLERLPRSPSRRTIWEELAPPTLSRDARAPPRSGGRPRLRDDGRLRLRDRPGRRADRHDRLQGADEYRQCLVRGLRGRRLPGSLAGKVAVLQRGTCKFGLKAKNAQDRGATAVIIFNEGTLGDPDRHGLINGTVEGYGVRSRRSRRPMPPATISSITRPRPSGCPRRRRPTVLQTRNLVAESTTGRTDRIGHLRRASGLRPRGAGHQRRRLGHGDPSRDRAGDGQARRQTGQPGPLHLVLG